MDLKEYTQLVRTVKDLASEVDQAKGALFQLEEQLKDKYGCESEEAAEHLRTKKRKRARKLDRLYKEASQKFEETYADAIAKVPRFD